MNNKINFINFKGSGAVRDGAMAGVANSESIQEEEWEQPLIWDIVGVHDMSDDFCAGAFFPAKIH